MISRFTNFNLISEGPGVMQTLNYFCPFSYDSTIQFVWCSVAGAIFGFFDIRLNGSGDKPPGYPLMVTSVLDNIRVRLVTVWGGCKFVMMKTCWIEVYIHPNIHQNTRKRDFTKHEKLLNLTFKCERASSPPHLFCDAELFINRVWPNAECDTNVTKAKSTGCRASVDFAICRVF